MSVQPLTGRVICDHTFVLAFNLAAVMFRQTAVHKRNVAGQQLSHRLICLYEVAGEMYRLLKYRFAEFFIVAGECRCVDRIF